MRSSRAHYKRSQRYAALATSLVVHALLFVMLAWVRATPPRQYELPPVDVSLLPPLEMGYSSTGSPGGGGGAPGAPGGALRRLDSPSSASTAAAQASAGLRGQSNPTPSAPTEVASRPQSREAQSVTAPTPPTPAELRPAQALAAAQPVEQEVVPELTARIQPLQSPLAAANRRAPSPALRPAQTLAVDAERPAEQLAQTDRPQAAPTIAAASRPASANALRPAQALAVDADRPSEALAQTARPQAAPTLAAAADRPAATASLRPAQTLAIDADRPADTLAARAAGPQAAPAATAAARPGATPRLQAAGGLAGPVGPQAPGQGSGQNQQLAGAPGRGQGQGQGSAGQAPGRGAGAHPGCEREVLILLTPEERAKCADPGVRTYGPPTPSNADRDRAARMAAMRAVPYLSNVAPEKRAYYEAVAQAKNDVQTRIGGGRPPGLACNLGALFGGKGGAPSERIKIPGLPCSLIPPVGVLTEEARISPP